MNILGNYQVWLGIMGKCLGQCSTSMFINSFDTQQEAVDFITSTYNLYKKPKWKLYKDYGRPQIETALKTRCKCYNGVLIAPKSSAWHEIGDKMSFKTLVPIGGLHFDLSDKVGVVKEAELIADEVIRWKIEFTIFNEIAFKYVDDGLGNWTGPGKVELVEIV